MVLMAVAVLFNMRTTVCFLNAASPKQGKFDTLNPKKNGRHFQTNF